MPRGTIFSPPRGYFLMQCGRNRSIVFIFCMAIAPPSTLPLPDSPGTRGKDGRELLTTLTLAAPIMAGHVGQMLMGLVDTLMIGRVGVADLAASALANNLFHIILVFGLGLLTSISVLAANAHGAGEAQEVGRTLRRGLHLGVLTGTVLGLLFLLAFPLLNHLGQEPEVVEKARPYLLFLLASLPFAFAQMAFKNFSEALASPWPAFWTSLIAIGANVFLNWVFIFGNLGAPAMGLTGAGLATFIARVLSLVLLFAWLAAVPRFRSYFPRRWAALSRWSELWLLIRLGFPIALQILCEVLIFSVTAIVIGVLGMEALAAHQIAITCAATTFMMPLGLAMALTIRVSHVIGENHPARLIPICRSALLFTVGQALVFALGYILFRYHLAALFISDPAVARLAAQLLFLAGCFQVVDGLQAVAMGALRGLKDVRVPTVMTVFAYWVVAFPLGLYLGFATPLGVHGFWIAFCLGLLLIAVGLVARVIRQVRRAQHTGHHVPTPTPVQPAPR